MKRLMHKLRNHMLRKNRVRATVVGTAERPRLSVHISNRHITAQIVDDSAHETLVYSTTVTSKTTGTMSDKAAWVGTEVAKKAKKAKVTKVVFDRGGQLYHGRVQALAEAARKEGLEF